MSPVTDHMTRVSKPKPFAEFILLLKLSAHLRKSQIHRAGAGIGPAAGDHFGARVELYALWTIDVKVPEQRRLPAAEAVVRHRNGDRNVHPHHSRVHVELKLARRAAIASEDRDAVAVGVLIDDV